MIAFREAAAGIYGAWRLARLDPGGLGFFDATQRGFWQSFWAAAICAPGYAVIVALAYAQNPTTAGDLRILAVHAIAYVISWTAFPLAMARVSTLLDRDDHYIRYVVAQNWASVVEMVFLLPLVALAHAGGERFDTLLIVGDVLILAYKWTVARTALAISGWRVAAVVALNLLIYLMVIAAITALVPPAIPAV